MTLIQLLKKLNKDCDINIIFKDGCEILMSSEEAMESEFTSEDIEYIVAVKRNLLDVYVFNCYEFYR